MQICVFVDKYTYMFRMFICNIRCTHKCFVYKYTDVYMRERVIISKKIKKTIIYVGKPWVISHRLPTDLINPWEIRV